MASAGKRSPRDPMLDEILSVMPIAFREMMGRMQAWTTRLLLAYADGHSDQVSAIHQQIGEWRRPIWDGAPSTMPPWQSAHRQAGATFDELRHVTKTQDVLVRASARQVGEGAAQMIRDHGPAVHTERLLLAAADYAADRETHAVDGLTDEQSDELFALFYSAASGWMFNRVFLARESGRLAMMQKVREGEQIALGVRSAEWGADIPDTAAIRLLGDVLDLDPAMLPPLDPEKRNLLEHDLVSTAKLHLIEHPDSAEQDRDALRTQLSSMITSFQVPARVTRPAFSAPKPGQRPQRPTKKRRR